MNKFDNFLARHPNFQAFFFGLANTFNVPGVQMRARWYPDDDSTTVQSLDQSFDRIERAIAEAERRQQSPDNAIVVDALNPEAVELLKSDPDEYFRRTRYRRDD